jgi:hypothetical protein
MKHSEAMHAPSCSRCATVDQLPDVVGPQVVLFGDAKRVE